MRFELIHTKTQTKVVLVLRGLNSANNSLWDGGLNSLDQANNSLISHKHNDSVGHYSKEMGGHSTIQSSRTLLSPDLEQSLEE